MHTDPTDRSVTERMRPPIPTCVCRWVAPGGAIVELNQTKIEHRRMYSYTFRCSPKLKTGRRTHLIRRWTSHSAFSKSSPNSMPIPETNTPNAVALTSFSSKDLRGFLASRFSKVVVHGNTQPHLPRSGCLAPGQGSFGIVDADSNVGCLEDVVLVIVCRPRTGALEPHDLFLAGTVAVVCRRPAETGTICDLAAERVRAACACAVGVPMRSLIRKLEVVV